MDKVRDWMSAASVYQEKAGREIRAWVDAQASKMFIDMNIVECPEGGQCVRDGNVCPKWTNDSVRVSFEFRFEETVRTFRHCFAPKVKK